MSFHHARPIYQQVATLGATMKDVRIAIMDAAEKRMRLGGFNGFSFREIATDVGVKSSSVHYHFPTKEDLAAAVIRRYTDDVAQIIERRLESEPDPVKVWTKAFRGTLHSEERMCPCTVLGAGSLDLPTVVAAEVKRFFQMCLDKMVVEGLSRQRASEVLSTITGAMVLANALSDLRAYDRATGEILREPETVEPKRLKMPRPDGKKSRV